MKLQLFLIVFLQAVRLGSVEEVYVGETVVLPSGVNPSWTLSRVEWSIFPNNTWIATYRKNQTNIGWFHQYAGRLEFNHRSGDLTIHNVSINDAMEYSVDLTNTEEDNVINKIMLKVKPPLQKPTLEVLNIPQIGKDECLVRIRCSSTDKNVNFSWQTKPAGLRVFHSDDNSELLAILTSTQKHAEFNCSSRRDSDSAFNVTTQTCEGLVTTPVPTSPPHNRDGGRNRVPLCIYFGLMIIFLYLLLITVSRPSSSEVHSLNPSLDPPQPAR